ncbi:MAG: ammonia-forming cytochrome c nitrite reductase subunit c552 [Bacteroidales bacterium]
MKNLQKFFFTTGLMIAAVCLILASCTKEGPQGAAGTNGLNGKDGTDGKDASETCKQCHAKAVVDAIATEFEMSKHNWGTTAFEEAGNVSCTPCHVQKAFIYVCTNNTPTAFVQDPATGKWTNPYVTNAANAIGEIGCFTCHSSLHTTYGMSDITLTNTAAVPMTMWGGAKTINLTQGGGKSNLCAKCHQPRPLTCSGPAANNGRLLNYDSIKNFPNLVMFDSAAPNANKMVRPSYRMHVHYGAVSAVYAGMGAIEYPGSVAYTNSPHTTVATCQDCHMADPMTGIAGGHSFNMRNAKETPLSSSTTWNFNGCNTTACHGANPIDASSAKWKATRTEIKGLLDALALKLNAVGQGHDILHADATASNLWAGVTTKNYDGYMDIYGAGTNDAGYWRDPYNTSAINLAKPKFPSLKFVQMGALINFQFCLREYSLGIHNTQYVRALLTNSVEALNAAGL